MDDVDSELEELEVLVSDPLEQGLNVFVLPLDDQGDDLLLLLLLLLLLQLLLFGSIFRGLFGLLSLELLLLSREGVLLHLGLLSGS